VTTGPEGATGVEVLTADGRVLGLVPLTDGGSVDASGATVAEAPIGRLVTG
jgi:hypothetical protein